MLKPLFPLFLLLLLPLSACSGPAVHRDPPEGTSAAPTDKPQLQESSIEISYELGHTHRKLVLQTHDQSVFGRNTVNKQLLSEGAVDSTKYLQFLQKASDYMSQPERRPAQDLAGCVDPYTMTVKIGKDSRTVRGCRQEERAGVINLIREGEFLLFSRK